MVTRVRLYFLLGLWLFGTAVSGVSAASGRSWQRRPGVVLYHLKENASTDQRTAFGRFLGSHRLSQSQAVSSVKTHHALYVPANIGDEEGMAADLKASGAVDFAEPDYLMPAASVPDDPQYGSQWFHQTINSQAAWTYTTGASSVLVAVCDTGIDASHPDLAPNLRLPGYNVVSHSNDTSAVAPHGTEVAGVLGAVGNNAIGVAGMNWGVKILPVRITNNSDTTAWCSDMASGIEWAADQGAKIINLSYDVSGCPATIDAASQYARSLGSLVFVAAGNFSEDLSTVFPASHSYILVAATDASDKQALFSNYGTGVTLAAPGASIFTTQPGGYGTASGTSFSSPLVAGVAALIYSLNPNWTPDIVENLILATAKPMGSLALGYGRVDAGAALAAAQNCLSGNCVTAAPLGNSPPPVQPASVTSNFSAIRAYPNPWRSDRHQAIPMTVDGLAPGSDLKIYTIAAQQVRRLSANALGAATWDLTNDSGAHVASGVYLFLAKDSQGHSTHGKLAVIR